MGAHHRRVALMGPFGGDNYGNDATLEAALAELRTAAARTGSDVEIRCVCSEEDVVARRFGVPGCSLHAGGAHSWGSGSRVGLLRKAGMVPRTIERLLRAYHDLRGVDVLCVTGTGALDDQHVRRWGAPLDVWLWTTAAWLRHVDLEFVSVGAGPIDDPVSRRLFKAATRHARHVSYRDRRSWEYMRSIGRDVSSDAVVPDLVLGLGGAGIPDHPAPSRRIALEVLWTGNWDSDAARTRYFERLVEVVHGLWDAGYDVDLIEGDVHDRDSVMELAQRLSAAPGFLADRVRIPPLGGFDDVAGVVAACAVTVTARYHNLVAAFLKGRPAVSLEYGFKNSAVMEQFGLGDYCHQIDEFVPAEVVSQVLALASDSTFAQRCRSVVDAAREEIEAQWVAVLN